MHLNYAIKFVSNMDTAVAFYRDTLAMTLLFQSPFWSEFDTGETKLALHPASDENPAGSVQLGLGSNNIDDFYAAGQVKGIFFTSPPTEVHGTRIVRFRDPDGAEISVSQSR
jgi:catechol 2,3-dioxygenase-like lactoylglutathione lyase family enzyme